MEQISLDLFNRLFEEVPCYCAVLDPDLKIIAVNRECRETFTTPFSRRCYQVFKGRKETCPVCPALLTLERNEVHETHEVLTDRSGRDVNVVCRTVPFDVQDGKASGVLHMSVRGGEGEELQKAMTTFDSQVGAVSHGIKGLLTAMAGGFYLWDSGMKDLRGDRLKMGVEIVRRNFHRLQRLAHGVFYYVRDRRLRMEPLDGAEILRKVAADLEEDARFAGAKIRVAAGIPAAAPVEADERALTSALVNLAVSSLDDCRTDKRDIVHEVVLSLTETEGQLLFEVSDNGIGMDQDTLDKVFSLFFSPKGIEAAGLGLYITNKLARAHKGEVSIESEKEKGTRYTLRIPSRQ